MHTSAYTGAQICRVFTLLLTCRSAARVSQRCNQLRIRMLHFVQNLQYYLSAEVLGTSWTAFLDQVRARSVCQIGL